MLHWLEQEGARTKTLQNVNLDFYIKSNISCQPIMGADVAQRKSD
jgi:hypothetical protein